MIKSVAVIGVGNMGGPMARRIHAAGYTLTACDANPEVLAPFAALGVKTTFRAADCASADLVIILVATPEQMTSVMLDPNGIADALADGHKPLIAVMSTVTPHAVIDLQQALAPKGLRVVDAPVSGGIVKAEQGTLTIMMGGEPDDIAMAKPVMECMGSNIFACGKLGAGESLKIVNNIVGIANIAIAAEAYYLAERQGLAFETIAPILELSSGRNFFSQDADEGRAAYAAWARSRKEFELAVEDHPQGHRPGKGVRRGRGPRLSRSRQPRRSARAPRRRQLRGLEGLRQGALRLLMPCRKRPSSNACRSGAAGRRGPR